MSTTLDLLMVFADRYADAESMGRGAESHGTPREVAEMRTARAALQSALSEAVALTRCACGDSFTEASPGKCVNCRAADGESLADKVQPAAPSIHDAFQMGATGGPAHDGERLAFEAWMSGHRWALSATWNGKQYSSDDEAGGHLNPHAMRTRQLWAAWRDRAALAAPPVAPAAPVAPQGWRLVPEVPTPEMRQAAVDAICYGPEGGFTRIAGPDRCWSVMLAAAPPAPAAAPAIDDPVTVPRGLLGAACSAIDHKRDAPKVLAELRRYTVGDLSPPLPPYAPPAAAPAEGPELPPHVCDPIPTSQAAERYRFEGAFKASALRRHLRLDHFLEADNAVQYASRDVRALWAGWLLRGQSAAPAEGARISQIDADYWLRHRSAILQAIADKGYTLMSNRSGFWLESLGKIEAQAAPTEAPND